MQISVKGKQIDVGDALRQHVESVLTATTGKFFNKPIEAHAVFSREAHLIRSDLSVHVGRDILLQGQFSATDAYAAFDGAADRIASRLRRYKRRLRDHHTRLQEAVSEKLAARTYLLAPEAEGKEETDEAAGAVNDQPIVIAEMVTEIPTLTVSEAVMRMDLADQPSFLFRNSAHGGLNVVYRRSDGHISWVDPEWRDPAAAGLGKK
jgi:ribosomal subunit interface protein